MLQPEQIHYLMAAGLSVTAALGMLVCVGPWLRTDMMKQGKSEKEATDTGYGVAAAVGLTSGAIVFGIMHLIRKHRIEHGREMKTLAYKISDFAQAVKNGSIAKWKLPVGPAVAGILAWVAAGGLIYVREANNSDLNENPAEDAALQGFLVAVVAAIVAVIPWYLGLRRHGKYMRHTISAAAQQLMDQPQDFQ